VFPRMGGLIEESGNIMGGRRYQGRRGEGVKLVGGEVEMKGGVTGGGVLFNCGWKNRGWGIGGENLCRVREKKKT